MHACMHAYVHTYMHTVSAYIHAYIVTYNMLERCVKCICVYACMLSLWTILFSRSRCANQNALIVCWASRSAAARGKPNSRMESFLLTGFLSQSLSIPTVSPKP